MRHVFQIFDFYLRLWDHVFFMFWTENFMKSRKFTSWLYLYQFKSTRINFWLNLNFIYIKFLLLNLFLKAFFVQSFPKTWEKPFSTINSNITYHQTFVETMKISNLFLCNLVLLPLFLVPLHSTKMSLLERKFLDEKLFNISDFFSFFSSFRWLSNFEKFFPRNECEWM